MTQEDFEERIVRLATVGCQRPDKTAEARQMAQVLWADVSAPSGRSEGRYDETKCA